MASYQIVCTDRPEVETPRPHRHIVSVGTGDVSGKATKKWNVSHVRDAIAAGDRFYTLSPSTNTRADVEPYDCSTCHVWTLRSTPDRVKDNNLDELRACSWKS